MPPARWVGWAAIVGLFLWSAAATELSAAGLVEGIPFMLDFLRRMVPPDFSVLPHALTGAMQTFQIAVVGTGIAALLALPMGFAAARNIAPPWLFYGARSVLNVFRAVDTLVYALFFVAAVGLGPFPGVLPPLVPQFLSFTLYRFETNIRAAAILGFVGAGGIGFYIQTYLRMLNYPAASTVLLVLIVLVMAVDFASSRLRARLV